MSDGFIGEIRMASWGFAPRGWALCQGQLLPINQNQALYALLGTNYGGDGKVTFGLPDLRARVPVALGTDTTQLGSTGGESQHALTIAEMPAHTHQAKAATANGDSATPQGALWATLPASDLAYTNAASTVALNSRTVTTWGGNQGHENQSPYLVINFMIALQGSFPQRP